MTSPRTTYRHRYPPATVCLNDLVEAGAQLLEQRSGNGEVIVAIHVRPHRALLGSSVLFWFRPSTLAPALFADWRPKLRRGEIPAPIIINADEAPIVAREVA